jgi:hypothetical protein
MNTMDADEIILATGVKLWVLELPGSHHPKVLSCIEVMQGSAVGQSVVLALTWPNI